MLKFKYETRLKLKENYIVSLKYHETTLNATKIYLSENSQKIDEKVKHDNNNCQKESM